MKRWVPPVPEGRELLDAAPGALERSNLWLYGFDREVIEATSELVRVRMAFAEGPTRFNVTLGGGAIMTLAGIWPHGKLVDTPPRRQQGLVGPIRGSESRRGPWCRCGASPTSPGGRLR